MKTPDRRRHPRRKRTTRGCNSLALHTAMVCNQRPGDPHKQLNMLLRRSNIPAAFGRERTISHKTQYDLGREMHRAIDLSRVCRMPIQNLQDLRRKHVIAYCKHWESLGLAPKTINKYVSTIRRFLDLTGKRGAIPEGAEWRRILRDNGISVGGDRPTAIAKFPKGWRDFGLNPEEIITAIEEEDELVGCQLRMQLLFGLRLNESCQIVPEDSDKGDHLMVWRGTKGGKERVVKFSRDGEKAAKQRALLEHAKQLASRTSNRCLGDPTQSLRAVKNRMTYLARKHGVSRKVMGVTMHGLRHQFACDLFRELTGLEPPVMRDVDSTVYVENFDLVRSAVLEIARQMGHERGEITYAYIGAPNGRGKSN